MKPDPLKITEAVKYYFRVNGISVQDAAKKLGITDRALYVRLSGRPLSAKTVEELSETFGFNPEFLKTGEGSLLKAEAQDRGRAQIDPKGDLVDIPFIHVKVDRPEHTPVQFDPEASFTPEEFWPKFWEVIQHPASFDERDGDYLISVATRLVSDYARVLEENKILRRGLDYYRKAAKEAQEGGFKTLEDIQAAAAL